MWKEDICLEQRNKIKKSQESRFVCSDLKLGLPEKMQSIHSAFQIFSLTNFLIQNEQAIQAQLWPDTQNTVTLLTYWIQFPFKQQQIKVTPNWHALHCMDTLPLQCLAAEQKTKASRRAVAATSPTHECSVWSRHTAAGVFSTHTQIWHIST